MIKSNYSLPHLDLSARPTSRPPCSFRSSHKKRRERNTKNKIKQSKSSFFSSLCALGQAHYYSTKNQNHLQIRIKARRKKGLSKGEERREEGGGQTSNSISNLITKNQVYHVHVAILRQVCLNPSHKSYLNASLSMLD